MTNPIDIIADTVRTAALAAIAEVGPAWNGRPPIIQATKVVRERTGADLQTAVDAVKWAANLPAAATLPAKSIVGSTHAAWFKEASPGRSHSPWVCTHTDQYHSDDEIDEMLRADQATVVRVGDGP